MLCNNYGTDNEKTVSVANAPDTQNTETTTACDFPSLEELMKPKNPKGRLISRIVSLVIVLALLTTSIICFWPYISNAAMYIFSSPQKHQSYIYKRSAEELSESCKSMIDKSAGFASGSYTGALDISLTGYTKDLLGSMLETDPELLDTLGDIGIDYKYSGNGGMLALDLGIGLKDISVSGELRADTEKNALSVDLPGISQTPLYIDLDDNETLEANGLSSVTQILGYLGIASSLVPDAELIDHLIPVYTEVIFSQIESVERERTILTSGDVEQNTLCFTSTLDRGVLNDAAVAVLTEMKADEKLKEHIISALEERIEQGDTQLLSDILSSEDNTAEYDAEGYYELLCAKADELIAEIEESAELDADIVFKTYTDGKGDIIAFDISVKGDVREEDRLGVANTALRIAKSRDGNKLGFELTGSYEFLGTENEEYIESYTEISVIGKGTEKADSFDGEIDIIYTGGSREKPDIREIATVNCEDVDLKKLEKGNLKGNLTIKSGSYFDDILGDLEGKAMSKCRILIAADCTDEADSYDISVNLGDKQLATIAVTGEWSESETIELHSTEQTDPTEWVNSFDLAEIMPLIMQFISFE